MRGQLVLACAATVCCSTALAQEAAKPAFAFADRSGTRLLAVPSEGQPHLPGPGQSYQRAACAGNALIAVNFLRYQPRGADDTGRQVSYNFEQQEGPVFGLAGGAKLEPDDVCLLAPESFFAGKRFPELKGRPGNPRAGSGPAACRSTPPWVPQKTGRPVTGCWQLAEWSGGSLVLVEYQRRPKDLLAALALHAQGATFTSEYPAEDEWRVDDEGNLSPEDWRPLFIVEDGSHGIELALEWAGPEGGNVYLLRGLDGRLTEIVHTYLYWAPQ